MRVKIKPTREFGQKALREEEDLLDDLADLGIGEKTYGIDDIQDAFFDVVGEESSYKDGTFSKLMPLDDFDFSIDKRSENSANVNITVNGGAYLTDFDSDEMASQIMGILVKGNAHKSKNKEEAYTEDQINDALGYLDYESNVEVELSDLPFDVEATSFSDYASVEAKMDVDQLDVVIDVNALWDDFVETIRG